MAGTGEPVPSLRVDSAGCWRLFPSGATIAEPGEWLTFVPWLMVDNGVDKVVYGSVVGVKGDVGINPAEQPPGVTADLFIPYLLAEVRICAIPDGHGGVLMKVAESGGGPLDFRQDRLRRT